MNDILIYTTLTLFVFLMFDIIQKKTKLVILNPLILTSALIIGVILLFNVSLDSYSEGTKFLTFLIKPATVALAIPLYEYREVIVKNYKVILYSLISSITVHMVSLSLLVILFKLTPEVSAALIPKSVTTAIALSISDSLGGVEGIAVLAVVLTGVLGQMFGPIIIKVLKMNSDIRIGLALGSSSHALGTAKAGEYSEKALSFSTISLILTGITTAFIAPLVYKLLIMIIS